MFFPTLRRCALVLSLLLAPAARALTPGDLDPGFGTGGFTVLPNGAVRSDDTINQPHWVHVRPDGSALVLTGFGKISHILPNGTVDAGFGINGVATVPNSWTEVHNLTGLRMQADGSFFVLGVANNTGSSPGNAWLAKFAANGLIDPTFGSGGLAYPKHMQGLNALDLAVQPDGRVLILVNGLRDRRLTRLLANGLLDASFGTAGVAIFPETAGFYPKFISLPPSGNITLAGSLWAPLVSGGPGQHLPASQITLLPSGQRDMTYNGVGILAQTFGELGSSTPEVAEVLRLQDGKSLFVGTVATGSRHDLALRRYLADGKVDTDFGTAGLKIVPLPNGISAGQIKSAQAGDFGKYLVRLFTGDGIVSLVRLNADGSLDTQFDGDGLRTLYTFNGTPQRSYEGGFGEMADQRIVWFFSEVDYADSEDIRMERCLVNGAADTSLNGTGSLKLDLMQNQGRLSVLQMQPLDASKTLILILFEGDSATGETPKFLLRRYAGDGSLDTTFGSQGEVSFLHDGGYFGGHLKVQTLDDKIVVACGNSIRRFTADGAVDTSFNATGLVVIPGARTSLNGLMVQPDEKILAWGGRQNAWHTQSKRDRDGICVRLTSTGAFDTTLDGDGILTHALFPRPDGSTPGSDDEFFDVRLMPNGDLHLLGVANAVHSSFGASPPGYWWFLRKVDSAGALLSHVRFYGYKLGDTSPDTWLPWKLHPDSGLYAVGGPTTATHIHRRLESGEPDTSFSQDGKVVIPASGPVVLEVQPDGGLLTCVNVSRQGTTTPLVSDLYLSRWSATGAPDGAWGKAGQVKISHPRLLSVESMAADADGQVLIAGTLQTTAQWQVANNAYFARLLKSAAPEISVESGPPIADGGTLAIGEVATGATHTFTVTLRNTGLADLLPTAATLDGVNAADFKITNFTNKPLPPGAALALNITFKPGAAGAREAALHVLTNDADESPYDVTLTGTAVTPALPLILTHPQSQLVRVGQPVSFTSSGTGTLPLTSVWKKGTSAIAKSSAPALNIVAAKDADAGAYTLVLTNPAGPSPSQAALLGVVTTAPAQMSVVANGTLKLACKVASPPGVAATFQWLHTATGSLDPLELQDGGGISGASKAQLSITGMTPGLAGTYTCRVGLTGSAATPITHGNTTVTVVQKPQIVSPLALADAEVGTAVDIPVVTTNDPTKITVAGLPPGVAFVGGRLKGILTTARTAAYEVKLTPANAAGAGTTATLLWKVLSIKDGLTGDFRGLVPRSGLNGSLGGTLAVTITSKASLTGSLKLGSTALPLNGTLEVPPEGQGLPGAAFLIKRTAPLSALLLDLEINPLTGKLTGMLQDANPEPALMEAYRTVTTSPVALYNARLTFPAELQGNASLPQGHGYLGLSTTANGTVAWTGHAADGGSLTGSVQLASGGRVAIHALMHKNLASAEGWAVIDGDDIDGALSWARPYGIATRAYFNGFDLHSLTLGGGRYVKPATGEIILNLAPAQSITFSSGGLAVPVVQSLQLAVKPPLAQFSPNPHSVSLTINAATGIFTGTFQTQETPARKAEIRGAFIPGASPGADGFFLLPTSTSPTSAQLSGRVLIGP